MLLTAVQLLLLPQRVPAFRLWGSGIHRTRPTSAAATVTEHPHNGTNLATVTVVIQINNHVHINDDIVHTLHALHAAYSGVFGRVVFTGQGRPQVGVWCRRHLSSIHAQGYGPGEGLCHGPTSCARSQGLHAHVDWTVCEHFWTFFSLCLSYAMAEFPQPVGGGGYLFIGDDVIFDPCRLAELDPNKFWSPQLHLRDYTFGEVPDAGWRAYHPACTHACQSGRCNRGSCCTVVTSGVQPLPWTHA